MDIIFNHILNWLLNPETILLIISSVIGILKEMGKNKDLKNEQDLKKVVLSECSRVNSKLIDNNLKKDMVKKAVDMFIDDNKIKKYKNDKNKTNELIESLYHGYIKNGLLEQLNKKGK